MSSATANVGSESTVDSRSSTSRVEMTKSGIPKAPFISDVIAHLGGPDEAVEPHLRKFQETMQKYKLMETDRFQRKHALEEKMPDIKKTLEMVLLLNEKKVSCHCALSVRARSVIDKSMKQEDEEHLDTHFELNDTLYAKAKIPPADVVHLWLGVSGRS